MIVLPFQNHPDRNTPLQDFAGRETRQSDLRVTRKGIERQRKLQSISVVLPSCDMLLPRTPEPVPTTTLLPALGPSVRLAGKPPTDVCSRRHTLPRRLPQGLCVDLSLLEAAICAVPQALLVRPALYHYLTAQMRDADRSPDCRERS